LRHGNEEAFLLETDIPAEPQTIGNLRRANIHLLAEATSAGWIAK
jgi:hypothetical protein